MAQSDAAAVLDEESEDLEGAPKDVEGPDDLLESRAVADAGAGVEAPADVSADVGRLAGGDEDQSPVGEVAFASKGEAEKVVDAQGANDVEPFGDATQVGEEARRGALAEGSAGVAGSDIENGAEAREPGLIGIETHFSGEGESVGGSALQTESSAVQSFEDLIQSSELSGASEGEQTLTDKGEAASIDLRGDATDLLEPTLSEREASASPGLATPSAKEPSSLPERPSLSSAPEAASLDSVPADATAELSAKQEEGAAESPSSEEIEASSDPLSSPLESVVGTFDPIEAARRNWELFKPPEVIDLRSSVKSAEAADVSQADDVTVASGAEPPAEAATAEVSRGVTEALEADADVTDAKEGRQPAGESKASSSADVVQAPDLDSFHPGADVTLSADEEGVDGRPFRSVDESLSDQRSAESEETAGEITDEERSSREASTTDEEGESDSGSHGMEGTAQEAWRRDLMHCRWRMFNHDVMVLVAEGAGAGRALSVEVGCKETAEESFAGIVVCWQEKDHTRLSLVWFESPIRGGLAFVLLRSTVSVHAGWIGRPFALPDLELIR